MWDTIITCCDFAKKSLDGTFGWFWDMGMIVSIVVLFNFAFKRLLIYLEKLFQERNQPWQQSFVSSLYTPMRCFVWFFATIEMLDFISKQFFEGNYLPRKAAILEIGLILSFSWFLLRWKTSVTSWMRVKAQKEKTTVIAARIDILNKLATVAILVITAMMLLEATGSNLNTLIAFGGISGLAIAFASQEVIASFFGGLMIYLTHPFFIGDWIVLPEKSIEGHVEEIGWYTTKIRTFEKRPIYVPNSVFSKIVVVNPSRMSHRQIKETIGIRYRDVGELKGIIADIRKMIEVNTNIDQGMTYSVYFSAFGSYSLDILFSAYTFETAANAFNKIKEELLFNIIDILEKHKAELAFPTTCIETVAGPDLPADPNPFQSTGN